MFFGIDAFDSTDFFDRTRLGNVATQGIDRVRRINEDTPTFKDVYHLFDPPWFWVFFVQSDEFRHDFLG
jgi:hypothetical protein